MKLFRGPLALALALAAASAHGGVGGGTTPLPRSVLMRFSSPALPAGLSIQQLYTAPAGVRLVRVASVRYFWTGVAPAVIVVSATVPPTHADIITLDEVRGGIATGTLIPVVTAAEEISLPPGAILSTIIDGATAGTSYSAHLVLEEFP